MDLIDIQHIFNRALSLTFNKKKMFWVFIILMMCGLLAIFFRALGMYTGQWLTLSLNFLPVFLCAGVLLATGVVLIRVYHNEVKKRPVSYSGIIAHSWDVILGTAYLTTPLILSYLLLWMLLGVFFLLNEIPVVGGFFSVILAFGPFLINLGSIILCVLSISLLFFVAPVVALKGLSQMQLSHLIAKRFHEDIFLNLFLATIAVCPFLILFLLLSIAAFLTGSICHKCDDPVSTILQWFIMMVPFTAALSPAVIFFFNFAAEAHVLLQRRLRPSRVTVNK